MSDSLRYPDLMVDIECLGGKPPKLITQIGVCAFDLLTGEIADPEIRNIDVQCSLDLGFQLDADTLRWWLQQEPAARDHLLTSMAEYSATMPSDAAYWFNARASAAERIWAYPAMYDLAAILDLMTVTQVSPDFTRRACYDMRTMLTMLTLQGVKVKRPAEAKGGTKHDAGCDAQNQAIYLCEMWKKYGERIDQLLSGAVA